MDKISIESVEIENPEELNFILGQSHFIKTVEDIHETLVGSVPGIKFGLAFCEASGDRLIRTTGTDNSLIKLAEKNATMVGAGHSFIIFLKDSFPINILNDVQRVSEVVRIFCATANPTEVIIAKTEKGSGILGVIDGFSPLGVENDKDAEARRDFLRKIGYKH